MVLIAGASASQYSDLFLRLNTDTGTNYAYFGGVIVGATTYSINNVFIDVGATGLSGISLGNQGAASGTISGHAVITGCNASGVKMITCSNGFAPAGTSGGTFGVFGGYYTGSSTISSISLFASIGNFDAGTVYVYTSA
jgi:hypothetical protein